MLSKAKDDQEMLDGIALMMKDAAADPEGFTLKLSGGINHMVEEEGAEGELWALKEKHGSQSGGGKRGTALKVPVELCTDEDLVAEYNNFDKARTDVTNAFARGQLSEEEKTSALEKQFARREEVKKLIQENVDLRESHGRSSRTLPKHSGNWYALPRQPLRAWTQPSSKLATWRTSRANCTRQPARAPSVPRRC